MFKGSSLFQFATDYTPGEKPAAGLLLYVIHP